MRCWWRPRGLLGKRGLERRTIVGLALLVSSIDVKPKHGDGPDFAREVAFRKIKDRVQGAKMASEKSGI